jgi:hypothetical protein
MTVGVGLESGGGVSTSLPQPLSPMELLSANSQGSATTGASGSNGESVIISPFGELILALTQVLLQNAAIFKETAAQAALRVQSEAEQNASNESKQFLSQVANSLQVASETGELPKLPSLAAQPLQAYSRTGLPAALTPLTNVSNDANTSAGQILTVLANQVNAAQKP